MHISQLPGLDDLDSHNTVQLILEASKLSVQSDIISYHVFEQNITIILFVTLSRFVGRAGLEPALFGSEPNLFAIGGTTKNNTVH